MRQLAGGLTLGCAVLVALGLAGSMWFAYLRNTRSSDPAAANAEAVVDEVRPYVLGASAPPWLGRYQSLVEIVASHDGGLVFESPCFAQTGRCAQRLVATATSLRLELPVPASDPNGPPSPLVIFRDTNLDGWPDAFAMTDNGRPWGACFDSATSLQDGFCMLPPRGSIRDEGDPMFGAVAMWMVKIQTAVVHQVP